MNIFNTKTDAFRILLSDLDSKIDPNPLYSESSRHFYKSYWNKDNISFTDLSFVLEDKGNALCAVFVSLQRGDQGDALLNYFGLPIHYIEHPGLARPQRKKIEAMLRKIMPEMIRKYNPQSSLYEDELAGNTLSPLGLIMLEMGGHAEPAFSQILDLRQEETMLWRQLRKSYRGEIKWGLKNLELSIINASNVSDVYIEEFRILHCDVAGRETRPKETWDIQRDMIASGEAFAVLGRLDKRLVTAALFLHSSKSCYYGVSASDRSMFDKPLSHVVIWTGIHQAKAVGCKRIELGGQFYPNQLQGGVEPSQKEINIGRFKRGFGGETFVRLKIYNRFG